MGLCPGVLEQSGCHNDAEYLAVLSDNLARSKTIRTVSELFDGDAPRRAGAVGVSQRRRVSGSVGIQPGALKDNKDGV